MTKLAPEWVRTSDPVIRSPARYRWAVMKPEKAPHCTKCGDPEKGHRGPYRSICMNQCGATESMVATGRTQENNPGYMHKENTLSRLVTQVTTMNINLDTMIY